MSDPFIGQIMQVAFNYAPVNWLNCKGQILQVSQNQALFALLGNRFGGNGTTNFGLPDAQGRVFVGTGVGVGLTPRNLGDKGGFEQESLSLANLPVHTHGVTASGGGVNISGAMGAMTGVSATDEMAAPTPGAFLGTVLEQDTSPVFYAPASSAGTPIPLGGLQISSEYHPPTIAIQNAGASAPIALMQPFQAVTTIIATNGIWPENPN